MSNAVNRSSVSYGLFMHKKATDNVNAMLY